MNVTGEQKLLAVLSHLAYLLGGLGFIIAPLLIFLTKKEDAFVYAHAKQALVAHLALLGASIVSGLLCAILVGFLLLPVMGVLWLVLLFTSVIAAIKAADGQYYEYPFIQNLVRKL